MAWQGIEGHDAIVERFVRGFARGRVGGSYLFVGPAGVGKTTFARGLAKALACHAVRPGLIPCGACSSCLQADAGTHPDIDVVQKPEDRATIPLDTFIGETGHRMREGLCWRILLRPIVASRKTAIILDADHLSEEGANCLLKTLEEPPAGAVIILVGTSLERQLPTIRSRCQIVRFKPLPDDVVRRIIEAECRAAEAKIDDAAVATSVAAAAGSLTRARLLLDPEVAVFRGRLMSLLGQRPLPGVELARETIALVEAAGKDAAPRRVRFKVALESAVELLRARLRHAAAGDVPADPTVARFVAGSSADVDELLAGLRQTIAALQAVDRNANLTVLVDAWTAVLEEPRLRASGGAA